MVTSWAIPLHIVWCLLLRINVSLCCTHTCFAGRNCCPWLHKANSQQVMKRLSTAWPEDGRGAVIILALSESVMMWIYIQSSSRREAQFLSKGCVLLVLSHSCTQPNCGAPQEGSPRRPSARKHSSHCNHRNSRPGQSVKSDVIAKVKCLRYWQSALLPSPSNSYSAVR